jgi:histone H3/H4
MQQSHKCRAFVLQEAMKFARHSKRSTLTPDDINYALKLRNVEVRFLVSRGLFCLISKKCRS